MDLTTQSLNTLLFVDGAPVVESSPESNPATNEEEPVDEPPNNESPVEERKTGEREQKLGRYVTFYDNDYG